MIQAAILVLGAIGATLIVFGGAAGWGYFVSFLGQPFWVFAFWPERKWGMFVMSAYFTVVWAAGVAFSWGWM